MIFSEVDVLDAHSHDAKESAEIEGAEAGASVGEVENPSDIPSGVSIIEGSELRLPVSPTEAKPESTSQGLERLEQAKTEGLQGDVKESLPDEKKSEETKEVLDVSSKRSRAEPEKKGQSQGNEIKNTNDKKDKSGSQGKEQEEKKPERPEK